MFFRHLAPFTDLLDGAAAADANVADEMADPHARAGCRFVNMHMIIYETAAFTPMVEAIPNRPRSAAYFSNRAKQLREAQIALQQAGELLKASGRQEYELDKILADTGLSAWDLINDHSYHLTNGQFARDTSNVADNLDSVAKFGRDMFQYVPTSMQFLDQYLAENPKLMELLQRFPVDVETLIRKDPEWDLLNPEYRTPEEIEQTENFIGAMKLLNHGAPLYLRTLNDLKEKVGAYQSLNLHRFDPDRYRPEHAEVETLYHASAWANEIVAQGFAAEPPEGRRGVGNLGSQNEISVTHDLKIAQDIMRGLKEFAMIANGQLTARMIADWIRREQIPNFPWREYTQVRTGTDMFSPYKDIPFEQLTMEKTAAMLRGYMWLSKIHPNPVFMNPEDLVRSLVGRPQNDIGILVCQVQMDPQNPYKHAESEFRIRPDQVLSIKRLM